MSRCIPFPPPGYMWNGATGEALLMAIKIRSEKAAVEKKREKEGRRKRKREDGELEEGEIREDKKSRNVGGETRRDYQVNDDEYVDEQSETSNLTEEHDQPICDSLYDSSDNSDNVKRKIAPTSVGNVKAATASASAFSSGERHVLDIEAKLGELFADDALPPFRIVLPEPDYQEWLFGRRLPINNTTEVSNTGNHDPRSGSPSLYPSAH